MPACRPGRPDPFWAFGKIMKRYNLKVGRKDSDLRLDHFLVKNLNQVSRSYIKKLIQDNQVLLEGEPTKAHHKVKFGQVVLVTIPDPVICEVKPENIPFDVVYEDDELLVINKPAGMVVHPAAGNYTGTLVNGLLYRCDGLSGIGGVLRPGIVHRLDKDTSGLMVVAKTDFAHRELARQFKERKVRRTYIGLVKGVVQLDEGEVDVPIGRHPRDKKRMAVTYLRSKVARTHYRVLERFSDSTLLELKPHTGRTHQIRIHMAHMGHPILGDAKYGARAGLARQMLHAARLEFYHPTAKKNMEFSSPLPPDFESFCTQRGG